MSAMSSRLAMQFLGPPQIFLDDEPVNISRRKATALLAFLALNGNRQTRDSLSALFWSDYDQSRAFTNLRHILWEVQQAIGEGWIVADRETVALNSEMAISLDVHEFESMLARGYAQDDAAMRVSQLGDAIKQYRGHFLTGFSLKDAPDFNDWAFAKAEDLKGQLGRALATLSEDYCAIGQADQAIPYARRLVTLDPLNESSHRQLMQAYIRVGQHSAALKQYQVCEQILRKELGVDPQPETRELYKKIRKREVKPTYPEEKEQKRAPLHNLPHQLSSFIGRDKDQKAITKLIAANRLVTLVGTGGIGKTSLALQVGHKQVRDFPDGVWFVALDSLSDPALVPQTVAVIFNIRERSDTAILEVLTNALRERSALLIFDNSEHLLDSCAQLITALLQSCPRLKILATSREAFGIAGEAIYQVPSLATPEKQEDSLEKLSRFESVRMFAERAALVQSSFQLTGENVQTIAEICQKVDGVPLAIELAAARVNILQVDEILHQLENSFQLLANQSRTISPRHQTLRGSMDWSWSLLSEEEQTFLSQLSVFAGGWTLDAAQAISEGDVLILSGALAKKSLLVVDQQAGRETRYRFHEIVREYALEKLVESGTQDQIRIRHLAYFLNLSERAEVELRGPSRVAWMDRLHDERNNLRAALHWAEKTDVKSGLLLSGRLLRYWESFDLQEGIQWLEAFLHVSESRKFPLARATALLTYGWLLTWLQRFPLAWTVTDEGLGLFREAGNRQGEIDSLISLANIEQFTDALETGTNRLHEALALAKTIGDTWRQAVALGFLGWDRRDAQQAFRNWEMAIELYREVGDQIALANLLSLLAQFRILYGDIEVGEKYLDESIRLWEANKRANVWEHPKVVKSIILLLQGEHEQAYSVLHEALVSARETGNRMSQLWLRVRLGYVALRAGNLVEAHDLLTGTLQDFHRDGYTIGAIFAMEGIIPLLIARDKPEKAARLIGCADATRETISDLRPPIEDAEMYRNMAAILSRIGPSGFEVTYDEGRSMSLDEGVAYALEED